MWHSERALDFARDRQEGATIIGFQASTLLWEAKSGLTVVVNADVLLCIGETRRSRLGRSQSLVKTVPNSDKKEARLTDSFLGPEGEPRQSI